MTLPGWLVGSASERRLLAGGQLRGPTAYVIAIMTFAMIVVAAAGLALANAAGIVSRSVEHRYTVEIAGEADSLPKALAAVRAVPGVATAEGVPEAEMRRTLERWLGPAGAASDLPVPALIHLDLAPGANADQVAGEIGRRVPGARLVGHNDTLRPLLRSLSALQWLTLTLVLLMAAATSSAVVLAARGALDTHRSTIDVMHGIGATDLQVTNLFQRKIAFDALAGSLIGGGAAAIVLLLLASGGAALAGDLAGGPVLGSRDILILALLPFAAAGIATWVARAAVLAALRRAL
jgi:cell division transport system permease protein